MSPLARKAALQSLLGLAFFIALIRLSAATWHYWQGWLFLAVFVVSTASMTIYMALYDRPLFERRMAAGPAHEQERSQKIIVLLVYVAFFAFIVLPILDYRFGFSRVPGWLSILGNVIIALSFLEIFWVIKTNTWAASNVRVEEGQQVVNTGPYAYVRHPMYAGAMWLFVGIPLALGSWWTIILVVAVLPVIAWRLLDEEKLLRRELHGYADYMQKVRYRLVPQVW